MTELTQVALDMLFSERASDWALREVCLGLERLTYVDIESDGRGIGTGWGQAAGRGNAWDDAWVPSFLAGEGEGSGAGAGFLLNSGVGCGFGDGFGDRRGCGAGTGEADGVGYEDGSYHIDVEMDFTVIVSEKVVPGV